MKVNAIYIDCLHLMVLGAAKYLAHATIITINMSLCANSHENIKKKLLSRSRFNNRSLTEWRPNHSFIDWWCRCSRWIRLYTWCLHTLATSMEKRAQVNYLIKWSVEVIKLGLWLGRFQINRNKLQNSIRFRWNSNWWNRVIDYILTCLIGRFPLWWHFN